MMTTATVIVSVVNFNIPAAAREYVHRVGRTARAGRGGRAISFVSQYDIELVQRIGTERSQAPSRPYKPVLFP